MEISNLITVKRKLYTQTFETTEVMHLGSAECLVAGEVWVDASQLVGIEDEVSATVLVYVEYPVTVGVRAAIVSVPININPLPSIDGSSLVMSTGGH